MIIIRDGRRIKMKMKKLLLFLPVLILIAVFADNAYGIATGKYTCFSFNVGGVGGSCTYMPQLTLKPDGSYQYDTSEGHWSIQNNKLVLSKAKTWGRGEILASNKVVFKYYYRGLLQVVTWVCMNCRNQVSEPSKPASTPSVIRLNSLRKFVPTIEVKTLKNGQYTLFNGATKSGQYVSMLVGKTGVIVFSLQKLKNQVKTNNGKYINHFDALPNYKFSFYFNPKTKIFGVRVLKNNNGVAYFNNNGKILMRRIENSKYAGKWVTSPKIQDFTTALNFMPAPEGKGDSKIKYVKTKKTYNLYGFKAVDGMTYIIINGKSNNLSLVGVLLHSGKKYKTVKLFTINALRNGNMLFGLYRHNGIKHKLYFEIDNKKQRLEFGILHPYKKVFFIPFHG